MSEQVGGVFYDVTLETRSLIDGERKAKKALESVGSAADTLNTRLTQLASAAKVYALALGAIKAIEMADEMRLLGVRVEVAAGSVQRGAEALRELQSIAIRTQTSVAGNAEVFARLNQSMLQMGGTQRDTLQLTELLGMAIKVSGASAMEAKSAMLQFGQALGSGKLAGDELRSLMENAPYLMRQLADGLGVPIGQLKALGEQGKLTSDVVVTALTKARDKIAEDFSKVPQTFAGALAQLTDAAARANESLDTITGKSAVVTGVMKGLAEGIDAVGRQFSDAATEADKLGRSKVIEDWASKTTTAFSYVADAADMAWQTISVLGRNVAFVFETLGSQIGAIAAMAAAAAKGEFAQAKTIWQEMQRDDAARRADLDKKDEETLRGRLLAGQRIRQQMAAIMTGTDGSDPLDRKSRVRSDSRLRPPGGGEPPKKFDVEAYLANLRMQTMAGMGLIDAQEAEAMRKLEAQAKEVPALAARKGEAALLIEAEYAQKRLDLQLQYAEDRRAAIEESGRDEIKAEEDRQKGLQFARGVIGEADPIAALQFELQEKSKLLDEYAAKDMDNAEVYAAAKVDLERTTAEKIRAIRQREADRTAAQLQAQLQGYSDFFGGMSSLISAFGSKQDQSNRELFFLQKSFAIASSLLSVYASAAKAMELGWPAGAVAAGQALAQGATLINSIKGTNYGGGRQYGGPVDAGSLYRINETGRPEMFTATSGAQYMLPTSDGRVTPASQVGNGGPGWTININEAPPGTTATVDHDSRVIDIAVGRAEARVAAGIGEHRGPVWAALRDNTNTRPNL